MRLLEVLFGKDRPQVERETKGALIDELEEQAMESLEEAHHVLTERDQLVRAVRNTTAAVQRR